MDVQTELT